MSKKLEEELLKVTGEKPIKKGESVQDFLRRIADAVDALGDDDFEGMTKRAQDWSNEAQKAIKARKDILDFDGEMPADDAVEQEEENDAEVEGTDGDNDGEDDVGTSKKRAGGSSKKGGGSSPKKTTKSGSKDKAGAKKADKPAKKAGAPNEAGVKWKIKKMLIKSPKLSAEDLYDKLAAAGDKLSKTTIAAVRSEFRHTIKVLNAAGVTKIDLG